MTDEQKNEKPDSRAFKLIMVFMAVMWISFFLTLAIFMGIYQMLGDRMIDVAKSVLDITPSVLMTILIIATVFASISRGKK